LGATLASIWLLITPTFSSSPPDPESRPEAPSPLSSSSSANNSARIPVMETLKVEEKRENFSQRNLRNPGGREREKLSAAFFEILHTKRRSIFSERTEKTWRKR